MSAFLGIDAGSTTVKVAILNADGEILATRLSPSGHNAREAATRLRHGALAEAGLDPGGVRTVATGYGRSLIDFANRTVTEITCHARGVYAQHSDARTIVDIGGQDAKAIRMNEAGHVEDFVMNDRCAAGTGSFLDVIARKFDRRVEDFSTLHQGNPTPLEISSTCVVFAESEVIGLLARGHAPEDVLAGVHQAIARRVGTMLKQVRVTAPVYFTGGVALNETLRLALETELETKVTRAEKPQFTGAIGAALLASESG